MSHRLTIVLLAATGILFAVSAQAVDKGAANTGAAKKAAASQNKVNRNVLGGIKSTATAGVAELTAQECKGLGGTVDDRPAGENACSTAQICLTTDKHGVIRVACIDEVASD